MLLSYNLILKLDRYFPLTGFGETCSDISLNSIVDEDECILAVQNLDKTYMNSESNSRYPTGCYLYRDTIAYFNKDSSDAGNVKAKAICKQGISYHFFRVKNKLENIRMSFLNRFLKYTLFRV